MFLAVLTSQVRAAEKEGGMNPLGFMYFPTSSGKEPPGNICICASGTHVLAWSAGRNRGNDNLVTKSLSRKLLCQTWV